MRSPAVALVCAKIFLLGCKSGKKESVEWRRRIVFLKPATNKAFRRVVAVKLNSVCLAVCDCCVFICYRSDNPPTTKCATRRE